MGENTTDGTILQNLQCKIRLVFTDFASAKKMQV